MDHLPVTKLNFGSSRSRYSWIVYQLGFLECSGKANDGVYPSELNNNRIEKIESAVQDLQTTNDKLQQLTEENKKSADTLAQAVDNHRTSIVELGANATEFTSKLEKDIGENRNAISDMVTNTTENAVQIISVKETTEKLGYLVIEDEYYFKYKGTGGITITPGLILQFSSKYAGDEKGLFDGKYYTARVFHFYKC